MLKSAFEAHVPCQWVTGDEIYGNNRKLRRWLEKNRHAYVLGIASNQYVWWWNYRQLHVSKLLSEIATNEWERISVGAGSKGERVYDWGQVRLPPIGPDIPEGLGRWLLVRRSIGHPEEIAYFLGFGHERTSLQELAEVAGKRWGIEAAFEEAKGEAGLDEYEVRKWDNWYRHITLSLLAHAYLVVKSIAGKDKKGATRV